MLSVEVRKESLANCLLLWSILLTIAVVLDLFCQSQSQTEQITVYWGGWGGGLEVAGVAASILIPVERMRQ
jgi:hypothetical protein